MCEMCVSDKGLFDFGNDCCLIRFVLRCPYKTLAAGWLDYWTKKYGGARMEKVRIDAEAAWSARVEENKRRVGGYKHAN